MQGLEIRRGRLTIRQAMMAIAVCAVCLWSPKLFVFGFALIFWWIFVLGVIYTRSGRRVAEWMSSAVIILILYALLSA